MSLDSIIIFLFCKFPFIFLALLIIARLVHHATKRQAIAAAQNAKAHAAAEKARRQDEQRREQERKAQQQRDALAAAAAQKHQAQEIKRAERERKQAKKLEAARQLAEYKERALQAQKKLAALKRGEADVPPAVQPKKRAADAMTPEKFAAQYAAQTVSKSFQGQMVAFTGKLSSMTRAEAVEKVRQAGGRGYVKGMSAGTTLLVVGALKGDGCSRKLDKADEWIGQVRKITEAQFLTMLAA